VPVARAFLERLRSTRGLPGLAVLPYARGEVRRENGPPEGGPYRCDGPA